MVKPIVGGVSDGDLVRRVADGVASYILAYCRRRLRRRPARWVSDGNLRDASATDSPPTLSLASYILADRVASYSGLIVVTQRNGLPASSTRSSLFSLAWKSTFRRRRLWVVRVWGRFTRALSGSTPCRAMAL